MSQRRLFHEKSEMEESSGKEARGWLSTASCRSIVGTSVVNSQGEEIGTIEDMMIDLKANQVAYVALKTKGFLGLGGKFVALPLAALAVPEEDESFKESKHKFILHIPTETLRQAPTFDDKNWPRDIDDTWLREAYTKYGYKPYWETQQKRHISRGHETEEMSSQAPKVSAIEFAKYLKGINFPADKEELVEKAKSNNAPEKVMYYLNRLPQKEYNRANEVEKEFGKLK